MKFGTSKAKVSVGGGNAPGLNKSKNNLIVILVIIVIAGLIAWVWSVGKKAEETIPVVMLAQNIGKNEIITESSLKQYDMLKGEFEKYSINNTNGTVTQRLVRWDDRAQVYGYYAAYPLMRETLLETRSLVQSRIDNTDSVLYSFPGKDIVKLEISSTDLNAFKTFLQPGDRVNLSAIYSEKIKMAVDDGYGGQTTEDVEVFKTDPVLSGVLIADIINAQGQSVLDMLASYNNMSTFQQAALDQSDEWKTKTEPKFLLVALTPDEEASYNKLNQKQNIQFKMSLPQRLQ